MAVTMSDEQFQQLMGNMRTLLQSARTTELPNQNQLLSTGNFAKCNSQFACNKEEDVEALIDAILIYNDCVGISDEIAVKGLPMLLDVLHDSHKLDMIYGLLHNRIQRLLPRDQLNSFRELIEKGRSIEDNILEVKEYQTENRKDKFQRKPGGGPTTFAVHRINIKDHAPISVPPYTLSIGKREFLEKKLDEMIQDGIIEECESPWCTR
ncbi:hypothetical protein Trydic_g23020 [Trypoxylus dichotomus]